ncbi:MAG: hypothetical protein CMK32_06695 [Porticoccaceae bacterium]|nr:hypothetical protein [Porticoccaceae bacterium]
MTDPSQPLEIEPPVASPGRDWQRKLSSSIPHLHSRDQCLIEGAITRPGVSIELRRFHLEEPKPPEQVSMEVCYLSLALNPRPADMQVSYLGSQRPDAYTTFGNCCFVPAGHASYARGGVGEYREICCLFDMGLFEPHVSWQWTPLELAACFDIRNLNIHSYLLRLADEVLAPGYGQPTLVDALFQALLVELSRHFRTLRDNTLAPTGQLSPSQLRLIEEKVLTGDGQELSVESLAELCGISSRHLSRMFKKTTGRTLGKYNNDVCISRAKRLLAQPDCLIKNIAADCGFRNQSSFSHAFRKATGKTPRMYREETLSRNGKK